MYLQAVLSSLHLKASQTIKIADGYFWCFGIRVSNPNADFTFFIVNQNSMRLVAMSALAIHWLSYRQEQECPLNAEDAEPDWSLSSTGRIILVSPFPKLLIYSSHKFLLKYAFTLHTVLVNSSFLISSLLYLNTFQ